MVWSKRLRPPRPLPSGPFIFSDVLDRKRLEEIVVNNNIDWLVHYAAVPCADGERSVSLAREVNVTGTREYSCDSTVVATLAGDLQPLLLPLQASTTY